MTFKTRFSNVTTFLGGLFSRRCKPRYVYLCAFFLPFLIMGLLWAVNGVAPFGSKMILAHDQWHQYYPFYLDLRRRLLSGGSLLHSFTTGLGTSYLPLFAYYLASPLNWIAALLPESMAMVYYTFTVLLRIGLAGLFFAYFLRKITDRSEPVIAVFSTMYAFSAFLMGYYWNAIWLDTVALLPLVVLGTLSLLREKRFMLYITSLALSVFCSYYIGFFVCLFVLLIFIGYHVAEWDDLGGFGARLLRIAVCTVVAIGMTAVLTLPTFLGMRSTSSAVNKFPESNAMNMVSGQTLPAKEVMENINQGELEGLFTFFGTAPASYDEQKTVNVSWCGPGDALSALKLGKLKAFFDSFDLPLLGLRTVLSNTGTLTEPTTMEGLPNIFCGFSTLLMALLFLFCKRISLRERIFTVVLLLFFGASFVFRTLDYIWHGLHFPNMLPYRFSFLWCFTVIWMGYRAYTQLDTLRWWRVAPAAVLGFLVLLCIIDGEQKERTQILSALIAAGTVAILILYTLRLLKREHFALILCVVMLAEALGSAILGVAKIGFTDSTYYPTKKEDTAVVLQTLEEREADTVDLWRAEVAAKQSLNDGTLLGIRSVSVFSSAANAKISEFLQSLGMAASVAGNRYSYQEADPFTNLLLGIKYLIDRNGRYTDPAYFTMVDRSGDVMLLQNKAYLPLGFLVDEAALEYDGTDIVGLPFDRLSRLFRQMTGEEASLFTSVPVQSVEVLGDAKITYRSGNTFGVSAPKPDEENCVEATVVMPEDGHLCIYSKSSSTSDVVVFVNGERQYTYSDKYGYNRYMGEFRAGDQISIRYRNSKDKTGHVTVGAALFHSDVFGRGYETLSRNVMYTTMVSDTRIEGALRVEEAGLLYTSIPCDEGWTVTVDGESVRATPVGDAMIAFRLEPGLHAIVISFEAPGFDLGLRITLISLAAFLALMILALIGRFSRPPIVKVKMHLEDPTRESEGIEAIPSPDAPASKRPEGGMPPLDPSLSWENPRREELPQSARDEIYGYSYEELQPGPAEDEDVRLWTGSTPAPEAPASGTPAPEAAAPEAPASEAPVSDAPAAGEPAPEAPAGPSAEQVAAPKPEGDGPAPAKADEAQVLPPDPMTEGTGVFRPVQGPAASTDGGTGRFTPAEKAESPAPHYPEDEIRTLEELDRLLKGGEAPESRPEP